MEEPEPAWAIPGYELGPVLGRGGFATVYRARQTSLDRDVAVKILSMALTTPGDRRRFDRERDALGRLSGHPHIVDVHTTGIIPAAQHPFLVMRLYPGGSLADHLRRRGRLPIAEVCDLVAKIASALDHAHAAGVIHRDVKPANMLLDEHADPALTDFGISGIRHDEDQDPTAVTRSTTALTYAYAAPEIIRGERASVASDVYALAATAYELLTGAPPFRVVAPGDVRAVLNDAPAAIEAGGAPPAVSDVVLAALAKAPDLRPPSAGAFAAALTSARIATLAAPSPGTPSPPKPPPATPSKTARTGRARPGRRAVLIAGAVAVPVAALGAVLVPRALDRGRRFRARPPLSGAVDTLAAAWSPDGTTLATSGEQTGVRLWNPATSTEIGSAMTGHENYVVVAVAWSPDGGRIASGSDDGTARVWNRSSGAQLGDPLSGHNGWVTDVAWSPDGTTIATASLDTTVRLWAAATQAARGEPLVGHTDAVTSVAWSPDGTTLATGSADTTVRLWSASRGAEIGPSLTGHTARVASVAWSPDGQLLASAGEDGTTRIWDAATHRQVGAVLAGRDPLMRSVTWSRDGTTLAAGDQKGTVLVWDATTRAQVVDPLVDEGTAYTLDWSPDGTTLAVGGFSRTLWSLS